MEQCFLREERREFKAYVILERAIVFGEECKLHVEITFRMEPHA